MQGYDIRRGNVDTHANGQAIDANYLALVEAHFSNNGTSKAQNPIPSGIWGPFDVSMLTPDQIKSAAKSCILQAERSGVSHLNWCTNRLVFFSANENGTAATAYIDAAFSLPRDPTDWAVLAYLADTHNVCGRQRGDEEHKPFMVQHERWSRSWGCP